MGGKDLKRRKERRKEKEWQKGREIGKKWSGIEQEKLREKRRGRGDKRKRKKE